MPDDNADDRPDPISDPGSAPATDPDDAPADQPTYAGAPSSESRLRRLARRPADGALLAGVAAAVLLLGGLGGFILGQATAEEHGSGGRDHGRFADHRR